MFTFEAHINAHLWLDEKCVFAGEDFLLDGGTLAANHAY
jgi:hypothetical protein